MLEKKLGVGSNISLTQPVPHKKKKKSLFPALFQKETKHPIGHQSVMYVGTFSNSL